MQNCFHVSLSPLLNKIRMAKRLMTFPSFEQTVLSSCLTHKPINIFPVITNGDYADDINYHYFQLLHPARPCLLWGQLPVEQPPPAVVHSLAEANDWGDSVAFLLHLLFTFSSSNHISHFFILSVICFHMASSIVSVSARSSGSCQG